MTRISRNQYPPNTDKDIKKLPTKNNVPVGSFNILNVDQSTSLTIYLAS